MHVTTTIPAPKSSIVESEELLGEELFLYVWLFRSWATFWHKPGINYPKLGHKIQQAIVLTAIRHDKILKD